MSVCPKVIAKKDKGFLTGPFEPFFLMKSFAYGGNAPEADFSG